MPLLIALKKYWQRYIFKEKKFHMEFYRKFKVRKIILKEFGEIKRTVIYLRYDPNPDWILQWNAGELWAIISRGEKVKIDNIYRTKDKVKKKKNNVYRKKNDVKNNDVKNNIYKNAQ